MSVLADEYCAVELYDCLQVAVRDFGAEYREFPARVRDSI
jgi:hypothetical protein